ncbi:MAG: HAMP domain-containing sensor histidine kinase [Pseudomonadota bacterium]
MPNRADHSVKTSRRDRPSDLKTWAIAIGTFGALIGALAVMFAGGPTGLVFGAFVLTTIIISQTFLRLSPNTDQNPGANPAIVGALRDVPIEFEKAPFLILDVSPVGRVRTILGQKTLLPGIRTGVNVSQALEGAQDVSVMQYPAANGSWVMILPAQLGQDAQAENERTNFFAGLGHDLKSPLNAVIGFAEIMDAELRGPMPEAYKDYPDLIRESGETLLRLVEDMLDYAKSESGTYQLDLAPMNIAASGESVLRQSRAMADKAGVKLHMSGSGEVVALVDADAVRRIWDNLVSNAIKYSSPGDTVTLTAKTTGGTCFLQVSDTGAGMDAEDLARIAKPFAQGRNAKGRAGTGLGLAMVQRLAEMQGGQVEIRTAPGAGTTVIVRLPAYLESDRRAAE